MAKFLIFFESKVGKTHLLYLIDTWHIETISSCEKKLRTQCYFFFLSSLICAEGIDDDDDEYSSISLSAGDRIGGTKESPKMPSKKDLKIGSLQR